VNMELWGWLDRKPLVLPLGLTDKTPAGRRQLALVFCLLAILAVGTTPSLERQIVWLVL